MVVFFGKYEAIGPGYNRIWLWKPDREVSMSAEEQYRANRKNIPGFQVMRISPVVGEVAA